MQNKKFIFLNNESTYKSMLEEGFAPTQIVFVKETGSMYVNGVQISQNNIQDLESLLQNINEEDIKNSDTILEAIVKIYKSLQVKINTYNAALTDLDYRVRHQGTAIKVLQNAHNEIRNSIYPISTLSEEELKELTEQSKPEIVYFDDKPTLIVESTTEQDEKINDLYEENKLLKQKLLDLEQKIDTLKS